MSTINLAKIVNALRPGVNEWYGNQPPYQAEYKDIYKTYPSKMAWEIDVEYKTLPLSQVIPEGSPNPVGDLSQRTVTQYTHQTIGMAVMITRQAIINNLYKDQFPNTLQQLKESINTTEDTLAASLLNNGWNAAFRLADGQTFFSQTHSVDGGTVANTTAVNQDLTEGTLEAAIIAVSNFKDPGGNTRNYMARKLIVPKELQFTAARILRSEFRNDTNTNAINAMYNMQSIPEGFKVNHFLTNPSAWFVMTNASSGLKHFVREPFTTDVYADFDNSTIKTKAFKTISFGVSNWRIMFASGGA